MPDTETDPLTLIVGVSVPLTDPVTDTDGECVPVTDAEAVSEPDEDTLPVLDTVLDTL